MKGSKTPLDLGGNMKFNFGYSKKDIDKEFGEHKEFYKVYFGKRYQEIDRRLVGWHYVIIVILWMNALSALYFSLIGGIGAIVLALGITYMHVLYLSKENNLKYVRTLFYSINIMISYVYFIVTTTFYSLNYVFILLLIILIIFRTFFANMAEVYQGGGTPAIWPRMESYTDEENTLNRVKIKSSIHFWILADVFLHVITSMMYKFDISITTIYMLFELENVTQTIFFTIWAVTTYLLCALIVIVFQKYKAQQVIYKEYIEQNNTTNLEDTL